MISKLTSSLKDSQDTYNPTKQEISEILSALLAVSNTQAIIEFDAQGIIRDANDNFCDLMGYSLPEMVGKHHRIFVTPSYSESEAYELFWEKLLGGVNEVSEYKRIRKDGKEVWIQASYNPISDENGKINKIIKFANDITAEKLKSSNYEGQMAAISKAQAVIEFNMDGTIITANQNFMDTVGYTLAEIQGQHHRMFAPAELKDAKEYRLFWEKLNRGEFDSGEYKRITKDGREIWIQASYNPIFDLNGQPFKVVKYATDITDAKLKSADYEGQMAAISKAQAVIEFNMDGTIITANQNFMDTVGYTLAEIQGQHHRMFAPAELKNAEEYRLFWEKLNRGEFDSGEYKRITKDGREIWIQASYNPIFDLNGQPFKVVKYATDITEQRQNFEEVLNVADHLSRNDLTSRITREYQGQYEQVKVAINDASTSINDLLLQVSDITENVSQAAVSLQSTSQELSAASEEQSSAVEEISANLTETDTQVQLNAQNSELASKLTKETSELAQDGQQKMVNMTGAMRAIADSSNDISRIIKVIDDIAFQTNLLALNAAVEAARAGQHGKGFAVVAQEVRNLAGRSAKAAKETAELIESSSLRVQQGVGIADDTASSLAEIVANVLQVKELVTEIAVASSEQSKGISQVNIAIGQVNQSVASNSQKSTDLSNASGKLSTLTAQLAAQIQQFELGEASCLNDKMEFPTEMNPELLGQLMAYLRKHQQ